MQGEKVGGPKSLMHKQIVDQTDADRRQTVLFAEHRRQRARREPAKVHPASGRTATVERADGAARVAVVYVEMEGE